MIQWGAYLMRFQAFLVATVLSGFCFQSISVAAISNSAQTNKCTSLFKNTENLGLSSDDLDQYLKTIKKEANSKGFDENENLDHSKMGSVALKLFNKLSEHIVGHDDVKTELAIVVQKAQKGIKRANGPAGSFLFLGVTGAGKSLTAEALAEVMGVKPIKINCAEYQQDHETARLTGAPPGYIGFSQEPAISNKILEERTSETYGLNVVLLDEVEKASPKFQKLFLNVFESGEMTDATNNPINFRNSIIIMTSNIGQNEIQTILGAPKTMGFTSPDTGLSHEDRMNNMKVAVNSELKTAMSPEFRNRIDHVFVYGVPTYAETLEALHLNIAKSQKQLLENESTRVLFSLTPEVRSMLIKQSHEKEFAGRSVRRLIDQRVLSPISNLLASGQIKSHDLIEVSVDANTHEISFKKRAQNLAEDQMNQLFQKIYGRDLNIHFEDLNMKYIDRMIDLEEQIQGMADDDVITTLFTYVAKNTELSDLELYEILKMIPENFKQGRQNGREITSEMNSKLGTKYTAIKFEPYYITTVLHALRKTKIKTGIPISDIDYTLFEIISSISNYIYRNEFPAKFEKDLITVLLKHQEAMKARLRAAETLK